MDGDFWVYNVRHTLRGESSLKKFNNYYSILGIQALIYVFLIVVIPSDASVLLKYHVSATNAKLIGLSFALPIIAIWWVSYYGFIQFRQYAHIIKNNKDGSALESIAKGLMYLAIGNPVASIVSQLLTYISTVHKSLIPTAVITINYISLGVVLLAFWFIHRGSSDLLAILKKSSRAVLKEKLILLAFAAFSIFYIYITLNNPARQIATSGVAKAAYYLPDWLLVVSIIVPYLFVWFYGISSSYYIHAYRTKISGILYKQALGYLAYGIGTVIIVSMLSRFLVSLTTQLNNLTLKFLLVLVYVLVTFIAFGFILIAVGAKKLKKMEQV